MDAVLHSAVGWRSAPAAPTVAESVRYHTRRAKAARTLRWVGAVLLFAVLIGGWCCS